MKKKISYVALAADILHEGHVNILKTASKYGNVVVGLLTDKAIASYKKLPYLNFDQRKVIIQNIKYVDKVIPQNTLDHTENLNKIKPDYVVHGDDWKKGYLKKTRTQVIKSLSKWGGKLIEPKYTKKISSEIYKKKIYEVGTTPDIRRERLKRLINSKDLVRILESHSALTGLIIEKLKVKKNDKFFEFDGMWSSSLTDSCLRGKPDNQSVDYSTRLNGLSETLDATTKPIIFDADNGGRIEHIPFLIKTIDRLGISAVIIEDKIGLKKNSLFENQKDAQQDTIENFCKKIQKANDSKLSESLMIVARIESLIFNAGIKDALNRAEAYSQAGADMIVIHSKKKQPDEVIEFAKKFKKSKNYKPLIAIPSTYSSIKESTLIKNGFKLVIYANHLLRSSYPSMLKTAEEILLNQRSKESEKKISSISEVINLIR
jgi:phosphoenolpyruvate phosphomutase